MIHIYGSHALAFHMRPAGLGRHPADLDVAGTMADLKELVALGDRGRKWRKIAPVSSDKYLLETRDGLKVELEVAWPGSTIEQLMGLDVRVDGYLGRGRSGSVIDVDIGSGTELLPCKIFSVRALYWLKMAHRYKKDSPHFLKTMSDIRMIRNTFAGEQGTPCPWPDWFKLREKESLNHKHPNLNQSKKDFFSPDVPYTYDHDSIHIAIAAPDAPAYTRFKEEQAEVKCSKKLFDALSYEHKMDSVLEETMVLAIERSLVPFPGALTPPQAALVALEKVCTSISSGWWREWAWENYEDAALLLGEGKRGGYASKAYGLFLEGLKNGTVKPHVA